MKRMLLTTILAVLVLPLTAFGAWGEHEGRILEVGLDVEMPYILTVDGNSFNERGNTKLGVHGNYFINPAWYLGMQVDFGLETRFIGQDNDVLLTPGTGYHFIPSGMWDPYLRLDVPLQLTNDFDAGISGGFGILWNFGELAGVDGLGIKYDFAVNYMFDAKTISLNIFRIAFAYYW